jgi:hypothetical protein
MESDFMHSTACAIEDPSSILGATIIDFLFALREERYRIEQLSACHPRASLVLWKGIHCETGKLVRNRPALVANHLLPTAWCSGSAHRRISSVHGVLRVVQYDLRNGRPQFDSECRHSFSLCEGPPSVGRARYVCKLAVVVTARATSNTTVPLCLGTLTGDRVNLASAAVLVLRPRSTSRG